MTEKNHQPNVVRKVLAAASADIQRILSPFEIQIRWVLSRVDYALSNYGVIIFTGILIVYVVVRTIRQVGQQQKANEFLPAPGFPEIEKLPPKANWDNTPPPRLRPFKPKYHLTMAKELIESCAEASLSDDDPTALETLSPSELILMDNTYRDRINYRRSILNDPQKRPEMINVYPEARDAVYPAIAELYTWLFTHYLPIRYPKIFKLYHTSFETGKEVMIENKVCSLLVPAKSHPNGSKPLTAERMLEIMAQMLDEDFLFLLPQSVVDGRGQESNASAAVTSDGKKNSKGDGSGLRNRKQGGLNVPEGEAATTSATIRGSTQEHIDGSLDPNSSTPAAVARDASPSDASAPRTTSGPYILCAYSTVCSNGFLPSQKLGRLLRDIHSPAVPGYDLHLAGSVDKFFSKLEVGRYVKRANWSITVGDTPLFAAPIGGDQSNKTHAYEGDEMEEMEDEIDGDTTHLRCERQTLHRLPSSKAIVFGFHTYLYPLSEIKAESAVQPTSRHVSPDADDEIVLSSKDALIEAIDGVKKGNEPRIWDYKMVKVWGPPVQRYLKS